MKVLTSDAVSLTLVLVEVVIIELKGLLSKQ